jgi:DNA-binding beta-propeller fold protein YncE
VTPVEAGTDAPATLPPLESSPPPLVPAANRKDATSSQVAFDPLRGGAWTANGDVGTVSYVDVDQRKVVQEIAVGTNVTSVALSPDAKWIAAVDRDAATVSLVDADSRVVKRAITLGTHPRAAVWDATDPRWLYVSLEDDDAVAIVDRTRGVVDHTIAVGRLPSGLAVSRLRRELAVMHRIDGRVTLAPLEGVYSPADQGEANVEVPLADEPPGTDDTIPNGKPFAFESLAWAPDGNVVWVPHELLANKHPFQFQRTLFPAISVADLSARAEVVTDPTTGNIDGRKVLFDAINIPDAVGNTSIVSQPCAAAIHPKGNVAYVLACASEDLLTFDVTSGIAVDLLRNLPGDHPSGITLDDTGQRAFVVSDQSHTMITIDLADGNPIAHATIFGMPIALVAKDPLDAETREGRKLFFRANSTKGSLATSGNDWMSCGGCHLDGFVSTNAFFFEALTAADTAVDAQIGHVGLKDLFSTAPTPTDVSFDPHDILVALLDQGGLAPDRSGAQRTGAIDPSMPSADAKQMAQRIARVIAKDLPVGPSWLLAPGDKPNVTYDAEWCGMCHQNELAAWKKSAHAHSAIDPMVKYGAGIEQGLRGAQYSRQCAGCHDPVTVRLGDTTFTSGRGITCIGCHDVSRLIRAGGNADFEARAQDWTQGHKAQATAELPRLRSAEFCSGCHQQFVPGSGIVGISTFTEWQTGPFGPHTPIANDGGAPEASTGDAGVEQTTTLCVDCHAPVTDRVADHAMPGGNVYLASTLTSPEFAAQLTTMLHAAIKISAVPVAGGYSITIKNRGIGHSFPTGVTDIREPWVEVEAFDGQHRMLARFGGPDANGLIPSSAARLGIDIADGDGGVLLKHELTNTTRIPFDRRVPAGGSIDVTVPVVNAPPETATFEAVLFYRNVRTTYIRAATGDASATAPDVEIARITIAP